MTIFSARERASTWRQLWVWLAEAEQELGLPIPEEAVEQMRAHVTVTDAAFSVARDYENKFRVCFGPPPSLSLSSVGLSVCRGKCANGVDQHDVMAHVHAYGEV